MSQTEFQSALVAQFDNDEFTAMQDDGVDEYVIRFESGHQRRTSLTVIAYFARLDPEATVEPA